MVSSNSGSLFSVLSSSFLEKNPKFQQLVTSIVGKLKEINQKMCFFSLEFQPIPGWLLLWNVENIDQNDLQTDSISASFALTYLHQRISPRVTSRVQVEEFKQWDQDFFLYLLVPSSPRTPDISMLEKHLREVK